MVMSHVIALQRPSTCGIMHDLHRKHKQTDHVRGKPQLVSIAVFAFSSILQVRQSNFKQGQMQS